MLDMMFLEDALYLDLERSRDETSIVPEPGGSFTEMTDFGEDLGDDLGREVGRVGGERGFGRRGKGGGVGRFAHGRREGRDVVEGK